MNIKHFDGPPVWPGQPTPMVFRGAWDSVTAYMPGNVVKDSGSTWVALTATTNISPTEGADWTAL